jgi:hypothetical protein
MRAGVAVSLRVVPRPEHFLAGEFDDMGRKTKVVLARLGVAVMMIAMNGCEQPDREWVLPDPAEVASWYGEGTEAHFDGNLLEIRGTIDPEFLRRGGRLWARSGPYFYLFNVHIYQLLIDYPDIAAVRATALTESGQELAVATLPRDEMNEPRWQEAMARVAIAQRDGTDNPRMVDRLIQFGEEHTEFSYRELAN